MSCRTGVLRRPNSLDHLNDFLWRWWCNARHCNGDRKVDQHPHKTDALRRDAQPVVFVVRVELEIDNVAQRQRNTSNHPGNGSFAIDPFGKDSHQDRWKERRRCEPKGEGHCFRNELRRWIDSEVGGDCQKAERCDPRREQLGAITDPWGNNLFQ